MKGKYFIVACGLFIVFVTYLDSAEAGVHPPSHGACRNIRARSVKDQNVTIAWEKPAATGNESFYYAIEYSDGKVTGTHSVTSQDSVVQHSITGLTPSTKYVIKVTVTVESDEPNQNLTNKKLRTCELRVATREGRPSTPLEVQSLCNAIVWRVPQSTNGYLTGYDIEFYVPGTYLRRRREVARDRTFYVVTNEDKLDAPLLTHIRVRARTAAGYGSWSTGRNIGCDKYEMTDAPEICSPCECPTCPTATETTSTSATVTGGVYLTLNGKILTNNSVLFIDDIGEDEDALLCKTNLVNCCGTPPDRFGEFYYPNGAVVPINVRGTGFYRNRGDQEIRLNRREGVLSPTGTFHCEIPNSIGTLQHLYFSLVSKIN